MAAGVQHASDDLGLQHVDLRAEVDNCHAAIEGLQAGGCSINVRGSSTPPPTTAGRANEG